MLQKIDLLRNIGRFETLQHRAEPYRRLALLFARNGFGKTTICAVLRSASSQDATPIDERVHLGKGGVPSAKLDFDPPGTVAFNNGSWNRAPPQVLIYDAEYIRTHVHAAEEVTRDNKRGLLQIIIGSTGVRLAQQITDLDKENAEINGRLRRCEAAIRKGEPTVTDVKAFVEAPVPVDLNERLVSVTRLSLQSQRSAEIARRLPLGQIELGENPAGYPDLLAEDFEGALGDTGRRVDAHLAKHDMDAAGRRWLRYGLDHISDDDCPFCDQDLQPSPIIEPLRFLFSLEYRALGDRLEAARAAVEPRASSSLFSLVALLAQNEASTGFWTTVVALPELPAPTEAQISTFVAVVDWMAAALKTKADNPSVQIEVTEQHRADWNALLRYVETYNEAVGRANTAIAGLKSEDGRLGVPDVRSAETTKAKYEALQRRDTEPRKALCDEWVALNRRHEQIAVDRAAAQEALRGHTKAMAQTYEKGVNELLEQFGANFKLCQTKAGFIGGPNTEYCIDINGHVLPVGESKGVAGPSFRTVLSGGDKASLALALFITQARQRADLADLILVFDDPFNSQDTARQFETSARIRELAASSRQTVVLSHDPRFLHLVFKDAGALDVSEHQVVMAADWNGTISPWSVQEEVKADYVRRAERIRAYAGDGKLLKDCSASQLVSDLRVFMEEYLDLRFPGRFAPGDLLGEMVRKIDEAGSDDPLWAKRVELANLNEYSRPEHHRGTQAPDPTQLRAQCRKVIGIIGSY